MMLWVWVPVVSLQKWILEKCLDNETLAAEDRSFFSLQLASPQTQLVPGKPQLQALQVQLTEVRISQKQLLQQVDNLTRNPGTTTPFSAVLGLPCMLGEHSTNRSYMPVCK